jgi:hypothetical protein
MTLDELISVLEDIRADHGGKMAIHIDFGEDGIYDVGEDVYFNGAVVVIESSTKPKGLRSKRG